MTTETYDAWLARLEADHIAEHDRLMALEARAITPGERRMAEVLTSWGGDGDGSLLFRWDGSGGAWYAAGSHPDTTGCVRLGVGRGAAVTPRQVHRAIHGLPGTPAEPDEIPEGCGCVACAAHRAGRSYYHAGDAE